LEAQTFDILQYSSSSAAGGIIRTFSKSDFDHTGMIFRLAQHPGEIFVFETNIARGAHVKKWSSVERHVGMFFDKVCLRQLDFERTPEHKKLLNEFMIESVGAKYNLNHSLAGTKTTKNLTDEQRKEGRLTVEERPFFCSELIAKCLE
jgi:hypothetical protein